MVQLNEKTRLIESISVDGEKLELKQEFVWYAASAPQDQNMLTGLNSAIYKLRTNQTDPFPIQVQKEIAISIFKGFSLVYKFSKGMHLLDAIDVFQDNLFKKSISSTTVGSVK